MDAVENPVLESRAERIARYKAERRRELAERFGNAEELPSKWVRRDGKEAQEPAEHPRRGAVTSDGIRVNGRTRGVTNGLEADAPLESSYQGRQGSQDSAGTLSEDGHLLPGLDVPQVHTRVSVGQLRSALLQQTGSGEQPEKVSSTSSLDLAVNPGPDGGRRRTRRYLPGGPGGGRKTNDRFRTQPITANEMQESSGLAEAEGEEEEENGADVKTDDRAKMSVAAKMSLFKELEKSAAPEASAFLKPRSGGVGHERRARRGGDQRFLTQPITCEEMVAVSEPKPALPAESQCEQAASAEDGDEGCRLSVSEKLALFNKLSLPSRNGTGHPDAPPERRRQKGARYRTQPITVEEVSLLQTGPVQLPAFHLSSHLSDRQQASSVNLKPSEVRLSRPKPDAEPFPGHQGPQRSESVPSIRGILKKNRIEDAAWGGTDDCRMDASNGHKQNGGGCAKEATQEWTEVAERQELVAPPRRARRQGPAAEGGSEASPPWRQRARNRRETIACTPVRSSLEQDGRSEDWPRQARSQEKLVSSVEERSDSTRRGLRVREESDAKGQDQVALTKGYSDPQEMTNTSSKKDETETCEGVHTQRWTNLSFEAQEVSSPTKNPPQPQWRQKVKEADDEWTQVDEGEEAKVQQDREEQGSGHKSRGAHGSPEMDRNATSQTKKHSSESPLCTNQEMPVQPVLELEAPQSSCSSSVPPQEVKEEDAPVHESCSFDGGFYSDQSPPLACAPAPCGDVAATEGLAVVCQTNTHILTSAVAEHRRSVRPSRRTQGSRNPLRALAAREDIRQDYMGDRVNTGAEERVQAEKKRKNSSGARSDHTDSTGAKILESHPPYSSLMLIHIKGRWHVQARLVEPTARSLNSGDCFLLVTPEHCVLWSGEFASDQEKNKGLELASFIQSHGDLGCRAPHVVHLEEGLNSDSAEAAEFWTLLGGRTQYRGAGSPEEDELYELSVAESNCVYRLLENRLVPHEEAWASVPTASLLRPTEALVLDFGSEVYLWQGRGVPCAGRSVALQLTQQVWAGAYDYSNCRVNPLDPTRSNPSIQPKGEGRPSWSLFGVLSQDNETSLFREKFKDWGDERGPGSSAEQDTQSVPVASTPPPPNAFTPCDAKALVSGQSRGADSSVHGVLGGVDVQRGHGVLTLEDGPRAELKTAAVDTWHVQEFDDSEVPVASTGQLHEGDCYVVRWTYSVAAADAELTGPDESSQGSGRTEKTAFFLWRGRHSSASGRDTAAFLSIGLNNQEESQVLVAQGKEPPCFLQLFQGGLVVHKGKREETPADAEWRLFCVRGERPEEGSLLEVDCCCAGLRSRGSVVLLNSQQRALYLWTGCKAPASTREVSRRAVERLTQVCPAELGLSESSLVKVQAVEEGSEPADFWAALGQMDRKAYDCMLHDPGKYNFTPRLFHLSASSGSFQAEELQSPARLPGLVMAMPFVQESLSAVAQPALFLLDNRLEVYLWQSGQPEVTEGSARSRWDGERKCAMQTALQYCREMNPRRPPRAYLISEGTEPLTFTNVFPHWETRAGPQQQGDAGRPKLTLVQDALAELMETQFPLEELLRSPLPEGVDPQQLEVYVSEPDFQTVVEMKGDDSSSSEVKKSRSSLC